MAAKKIKKKSNKKISVKPSNPKISEKIVSGKELDPRGMKIFKEKLQLLTKGNK